LRSAVKLSNGGLKKHRACEAATQSTFSHTACNRNEWERIKRTTILARARVSFPPSMSFSMGGVANAREIRTSCKFSLARIRTGVFFAVQLSLGGLWECRATKRRPLYLPDYRDFGALRGGARCAENVILAGGLHAGVDSSSFSRPSPTNPVNVGATKTSTNGHE
jgi:hypothetical protein